MQATFRNVQHVKFPINARELFRKLVSARLSKRIDQTRMGTGVVIPVQLRPVAKYVSYFKDGHYIQVVENPLGLIVSKVNVIELLKLPFQTEHEISSFSNDRYEIT